jgi:hypothetical protein
VENLHRDPHGFAVVVWKTQGNSVPSVENLVVDKEDEKGEICQP